MQRHMTLVIRLKVCEAKDVSVQLMFGCPSIDSNNKWQLLDLINSIDSSRILLEGLSLTTARAWEKVLRIQRASYFTLYWLHSLLVLIEPALNGKLAGIPQSIIAAYYTQSLSLFSCSNFFYHNRRRVYRSGGVRLFQLMLINQSTIKTLS